MNRDGILALLNDDPWAQKLLTSSIPARLAYTALDGTPRAIPIGWYFTGESFVMATVPFSAKVAALQASPAVAFTIDTDDFPPIVLMVRGTAEIEIVDGVPWEYLEASRRSIPEEQWDGFEQQVTALYDRMARIEITPTWAKVLDFETRAPEAVMKLAAQKAAEAAEAGAGPV